MPRARRAASVAHPNGAKHSKKSAGADARTLATTQKLAGASANEHECVGGFTAFAHAVARLAGKPAAFLSALAMIIVWAVSGPLFGFSDTWQLVVNTATTIVTFLMVFLIQNTQNRDTMALQIKLSELIMAVRGAHNNMATAEDMSEEELEALHREYRQRAEQTGETLERRRGQAESKH